MSRCPEGRVAPADHMVADECKRCDCAADEGSRATAAIMAVIAGVEPPRALGRWSFGGPGGSTRAGTAIGRGGAGGEAAGGLAQPFTCESTFTSTLPSRSGDP